jgi:Domain of unknown function (DUF1707)
VSRWFDYATTSAWRGYRWTGPDRSFDRESPGGPRVAPLNGLPADDAWDDVPGVRLRASDADREQTVQVLWAGVAHGVLTPEEGEDRITGAYAVVYRDELWALTADFPPGLRGSVTDRAPARASALAGLFGHCAAVGLVACMLIGGWLWDGSGFFWPAFPIAILVLGFVLHVWRVRRLSTSVAGPSPAGRAWIAPR